MSLLSFPAVYWLAFAFALAHISTAFTAVGAAFAAFFSDETTAEGCETVGEEVQSAIVYHFNKEDCMIKGARDKELGSFQGESVYRLEVKGVG